MPVRIHLDGVPPDVRLAAGMTASVEIDPRPAAERQPAATTHPAPPRDGDSPVKPQP